MEDISADFVTELKGDKFQLSLEQFKKQKIKFNGKEEDGDLFLVENVFPVVLEGLERLSKEVEDYMKNPGVIDMEVRKRFNPCIFLAQFLMRNNPKFNEEKKDDPTYMKIQQYVRQERFSRLFSTKKPQFLKFFLDTTKMEQPQCDLANIRIFAQKLDEQSNQKGKLKDFLLLNKTLNNLTKKSKNQISFDCILQQIIKYCSQHDHVLQSDFDKILQ